MGTVTRFQILDGAVCILHSTHTLGKNMYSTILPPAKANGKTDWAFKPIFEKENFEFKPLKLC